MAKKSYSERNLKFETLQLHVGQEQPDPVTDARAVPIYLTSSYVFHNSKHAADRFGLKDAGNIYGRLTNPTEDVFEKRIAALEGGVAALAVGSGAAALAYAFQALAHAGDHIVAAKNIYGGTYNLLAHTLPDYGIEATFVDPFDYDAIEAAIKPNTKAVQIETLGNPNSEVVDIERIAKIAHAHNIPLVVDNTFATPYLVRPIEYGADIVIHSATKFIGGHGTTLGGVIVDSGKFDWVGAADKFPWLVEPNVSYHGVSFAKDTAPAAFVTYIRAILLRDTGATISPIHSFIFLQGLETLSLRVERHVENALKVVQYLKEQPLVEKVNHPSISTNEEQQALSELERILSETPQWSSEEELHHDMANIGGRVWYCHYWEEHYSMVQLTEDRNGRFNTAYVLDRNTSPEMRREAALLAQKELAECMQKWGITLLDAPVPEQMKYDSLAEAASHLMQVLNDPEHITG